MTIPELRVKSRLPQVLDQRGPEIRARREARLLDGACQGLCPEAPPA